MSQKFVGTFSRARRAPVLRLATLTALMVVLIGRPAHAQLEVTASGGYRAGSLERFPTRVFCIALVGVPCPTMAEGDDGGMFGAIVDVRFNDAFAVEVLASKQLSTLRFISVPFRTDQFDDDLDVTTVHGGLVYRWPTGRLRPFVAGGTGVTHLKSESRLVSIGSDSFSASIAGGVFVSLVEHVGLRFEGREYWVQAPDHYGGSFSHLDLTGGVTVRW